MRHVIAENFGAAAARVTRHHSVARLFVRTGLGPQAKKVENIRGPEPHQSDPEFLGMTGFLGMKGVGGSREGWTFWGRRRKEQGFLANRRGGETGQDPMSGA